MLDRQPYRGAFGGAGEIGHMIVKPGGRPCPCGSRGCLEQYVSLYSAAEMVCGPERTPDEVPAEEIVEYLRARDPRILAWQQEAGEYLKIAIRNIEAIFDPDTVVIGGGLPPAMMEGLVAAASPLLPSMMHRRASALPRLMPAEHASERPALGAAALPMAMLLQADGTMRLGLHRPRKCASARTRRWQCSASTSRKRRKAIDRPRPIGD